MSKKLREKIKKAIKKRVLGDVTNIKNIEVQLPTATVKEPSLAAAVAAATPVAAAVAATPTVNPAFAEFIKTEGTFKSGYLSLEEADRILALIEEELSDPDCSATKQFILQNLKEMLVIGKEIPAQSDLLKQALEKANNDVYLLDRSFETAIVNYANVLRQYNVRNELIAKKLNTPELEVFINKIKPIIQDGHPNFTFGQIIIQPVQRGPRFNILIDEIIKIENKRNDKAGKVPEVIPDKVSLQELADISAKVKDVLKGIGTAKNYIRNIKPDKIREFVEFVLLDPDAELNPAEPKKEGLTFIFSADYYYDKSLPEIITHFQEVFDKIDAKSQQTILFFIDHLLSEEKNKKGDKRPLKTALINFINHIEPFKASHTQLIANISEKTMTLSDEISITLATPEDRPATVAEKDQAHFNDTMNNIALNQINENDRKQFLRDLSESIGITNQVYFSQIPVNDFYTAKTVDKEVQDAPGLKLAIDFFNNITNAVWQNLFYDSDGNLRSDIKQTENIFKFYVELCNELINIGDINGAMAIQQALENSVCDRLAIHETLKDTLAALNEKLNSAYNYRAPRANAKNGVPPFNAISDDLYSTNERLKTKGINEIQYNHGMGGTIEGYKAAQNKLKAVTLTNRPYNIDYFVALNPKIDDKAIYAASRNMNPDLEKINDLNELLNILDHHQTDNNLQFFKKAKSKKSNKLIHPTRQMIRDHIVHLVETSNNIHLGAALASLERVHAIEPFKYFAKHKEKVLTIILEKIQTILNKAPKTVEDLISLNQFISDFSNLPDMSQDSAAYRQLLELTDQVIISNLKVLQQSDVYRNLDQLKSADKTHIYEHQLNALYKQCDSATALAADTFSKPEVSTTIVTHIVADINRVKQELPTLDTINFILANFAHTFDTVAIQELKRLRTEFDALTPPNNLAEAQIHIEYLNSITEKSKAASRGVNVLNHFKQIEAKIKHCEKLRNDIRDGFADLGDNFIQINDKLEAISRDLNTWFNRPVNTMSKDEYNAFDEELGKAKLKLTAIEAEYKKESNLIKDIFALLKERHQKMTRFVQALQAKLDAIADKTTPEAENIYKLITIYSTKITTFDPLLANFEDPTNEFKLYKIDDLMMLLDSAMVLEACTLDDIATMFSLVTPPTNLPSPYSGDGKPFSDTGITRLDETLTKLMALNKDRSIAEKHTALKNITDETSKLFKQVMPIVNLNANDITPLMVKANEAANDKKFIAAIKAIVEIDPTRKFPDITSILRELDELLVSNRNINVEIADLSMKAALNPADPDLAQRKRELVELSHDILDLSLSFKALENINIDSLSDEYKDHYKNMMGLYKVIINLYSYSAKIGSLGGAKDRDLLLGQIAKGDFFNETSREALKLITYTLPQYLPAVALFNAIDNNIDTYTEAQAADCIRFIEMYLQFDKDNKLLPALEEDNPFTLKLLQVLDHLQSKNPTTLTPLVEAAQDQLQLMIREKQDRFASNLALLHDEIHSGRKPFDFLYFQFKTFAAECEDTPPDATKWHEYTQVITVLLQSWLSSSQMDYGFTEQMRTQLFASLKPILTNPTLPATDKAKIDILVDEFNNLPLTPLQPQEASIENNPLDPNELDLNQLFANISVGNFATDASYKSAIDEFVNCIQAGFDKRLVSMPIYEFYEAANQENDKALKKQQLPPAMHYYDYCQYGNMMTYFLKFAIFHHLKADQYGSVVYSNLHRIRKICAFLEDAADHALATGDVSTGITIHEALSSVKSSLQKVTDQAEVNEFIDPDRHEQRNRIVAMKPAELEAYYAQQRVTYKPNIAHKISFLSLIKNDLPIEIQKRMLGSALQEFVDIQERLKSSTDPQPILDPMSQVTDIMKDNGIMQAARIPGELIVSDNETNNRVKSAVSFLTSPNFTHQHVDEFTDIASLKEHLMLCHERMTDFHLDDAAVEKNIAHFLLDQIKSDTSFSLAQDCFTILRLERSIDKRHHRVYKDYNRDLAMVLAEYKKFLDQTMAGDLTKEQYDHLTNFYAAFYSDKGIRELRSESSSNFNMFSSEYKVKTLIKSIDEQYETYRMKKPSDKPHATQPEHAQAAHAENDTLDTLTNLLGLVLEGNDPAGLAEVFNKTYQASKENPDEGLFPGTWPPYSGDPEATVPPSDIIKAMKKDVKKSLFESFNAKSLQDDFLAAFPWATTTNKANQIGTIIPNPDENLLGTPIPLKPEVQLKVMEYIIISIDILGKVAGNDGEQVVSNYDIIKKVVDDLSAFADLLEDPNTSEDKLRKTAEKHMQYYSAFDKQIFADISSHANKRSFEVNPEVHDFCYLNEELARCLLGLPTEKCLLTPDTPIRNLPMLTVQPKQAAPSTRH